MNFDQLIEPHLELIKRKHRSRVFGDLEGSDCHFPQAFDYRLQRKVTDWCSSDYLSMSEHPAVLAAMRDVIDQTGGSAGGTRDISEASRYRVLLENELAELHDKESALLFTSGYLANEAAVSTLAGRISECIVFSDAANPASIIEGIQHSGAECQIFRHNDPVIPAIAGRPSPAAASASVSALITSARLPNLSKSCSTSDSASARGLPVKSMTSSNS